MNRWVIALGGITVLGTLWAVESGAVKPPVAKVLPKRFEEFGNVRVDNYYWLKERENPEVLRYLQAENDYTKAVMAHTAPLQETLFHEFKTRIKQTDVSVPYRKRDYYYYSRTEEGKNYPIYCRKKGSVDAAEEVMLDTNQLCEGHKYCAARPADIATGQELVVYAIDTVGRRFYTLRVKNLTTGQELADTIPDVTGNVTFANDNKTLFYTKQDPATLRSYRVYRHVLGSDPAKDELIYEEKDETFGVSVFKTKSEKYVMIVCDQTLSTEYRYLDADQPQGAFRVFQPRQRDHEYGVDHYKDSFYVRTNHQAKNFRLMKTPVDKTGMENWTEVLPHRDDVLLEDIEIFRDYLVVSERKNGLLQLRIRPWTGGDEHYVDFGEPAYVAFPSANFEFDTKILRFNYSSMTTPGSVFDYDMATRQRKLLKRDEVLGGFDSANYRTERVYVKARDGKSVPLSLVYRLPFAKDGKRPLLVYGYGSYGASSDAGFDPFRISLLDRGFVYALAHVRGGEELGRAWYEDGKLLNKKHTFTDFIDCTEYLLHERYADPKRVFAWGGSAGGLLVGAVVTMRPELWTGAIAEVPFVDVVTTMLDDSIPLTTGEFDEWGNPKDQKFYDYILSYSPYDQTKAAAYPNLLVTTGLHDSQVQYWEPAKWVAKLRALKTDDRHVLLKTEMEAGHGGLSSRDDRYRERAFRYAFLLDVAGIAR
ncbi:MAG TPA: S9 family peptidase [Candidatus Polarisedimenticolaceae bacterium]|nr:S9 family peptidase [Candidatus Polarisedimenticolaceae bacterium]